MDYKPKNNDEFANIKVWQIIKDQKPRFYTLKELNNKIIEKSKLDETKENRKNESPSFILESDDLKDEKWELYPVNTSRWRNQYKDIQKIEVSNMGRVKLNENIIEQEDENGKIGYLQLKGYPALGKIWTLVAKVWLIKDGEQEEASGNWEVHHITNNGYDNRPENLIWIKKSYHSKINHRLKQ